MSFFERIQRQYQDTPSVRVLDYDDAATFDTLWAHAATASPDDPLAEDGVVVVVQGEPPNEESKGRRTIRSYVTAFDWSVYALHLLYRSGRDPGVRIEIVGPVRPFKGPGLRSTQNSVKGLGWNATAFSLPNVSADELRQRERLTRDRLEDGIQRLGPTWRAELARSGDRHHVSNLIAPLLIAEGLSTIRGVASEPDVTVSSEPAVNALLRLLRALGLIAAADRYAKNLVPLAERPRIYNDAMGRFGSVRFYLVDDDAHRGFDRVLPAVLQTGHRSDRDYNWMFSETKEREWHPQSEAPPPAFARLIEDLKAALTTTTSKKGTVDWTVPRALHIHAESGEQVDVLLLDLRLFGEDDQPLPAEQAALKSLLALIDEYHVRSISDPYLHRAIRAAQNRLESREGPASLLHLALLPLLITHVDPSFPVVIFSSTRQRSLLQAFEEHPSLITTFVKPGAAGYVEEAPEEATASLLDALEQALLLHEARGVWERLVSAEWRVRPMYRTVHPRIVEAEEEDVRNVGYRVYNARNVGEAIFAMRRSGVRGRIEDVENLEGRPIDDDRLRKTLSIIYNKYVVRVNGIDFHSVAIQTTEGLLVPRSLRRSSSIDNPRFSVPWAWRPNHSYGVLSLARNSIAHGTSDSLPTDPSELEAHRVTMLLGFHLWLDWICTDTSSWLPPIDGRQRAELEARQRELVQKLSLRRSESLPLDNLEPRKLAALSGMRWLDTYLGILAGVFSDEEAPTLGLLSYEAAHRLISLAIGPRRLMDPPKIETVPILLGDPTPSKEGPRCFGTISRIDNRSSLSIMPLPKRNEGLWPDSIPPMQPGTFSIDEWDSKDEPSVRDKVSFLVSTTGHRWIGQSVRKE